MDEVIISCKGKINEYIVFKLSYLRDKIFSKITDVSFSNTKVIYYGKFELYFDLILMFVFGLALIYML